MTLAELIAGLQASQAVGYGATGADLTMTAEEERRELEAADRDWETAKVILTP